MVSQSMVPLWPTTNEEGSFAAVKCSITAVENTPPKIQEPASTVRPSQWLHHGLSGDAANARYDLPTTRTLLSTRTIQLTAPCEGDTSLASALKKEEIRVYFHNTFEVFEKVFEPLDSDDAYTIQPIHKLRHPMIFYLGHTAAFYINKLVLAGVTTRVNPTFEKMFAIGVDEMSWDDLNPGHYNWPSVQEVWEYRQLVRDRVDQIIRQNKLHFPCTFNESANNMNTACFWVIMMGIEHERIHLETASVHLRELPLHLVRSHPFWAPCTQSGTAPAQNPLVHIGGGPVTVGRQHSSKVYGWDVDYSDNYIIDVAPFQASQFLATNADFKEFIDAGGYTTERYWDREGWSWTSWKKPTMAWFWTTNEEGKYFLRTQTCLIEMPWDWPAEVNHLEACAYVRWKAEQTGKNLRLPTEAEFLRMWDLCVGVDQYDWDRVPGNVNLEQYRSSCPVTLNAQGPLFDVTGNVWQHCETRVYPYPGYRVHPVYDDFSMPTFDGRHSCIKGGSWVSTGNEATRDARYAFRRHFFQFVGIRYVEGVDVDETTHFRSLLGADLEVDTKTQVGYEDHALLGTSVCFPRDCAVRAIEIFQQFHNKDATTTRVLDLYCGAGRSTFELAKYFTEVYGVERSARPLQCGFALKERGSFTYSAPTITGERVERSVHLSKYDFANVTDRVTFVQCDATNLHAHLDRFDLILAWDVLHQSYAPRKVLAELLSRLNTDGILVVVSAYDWDAQLTPKTEWLNVTSDSTGKQGDLSKDHWCDPNLTMKNILETRGNLKQLLPSESSSSLMSQGIAFYLPRTATVGEFGVAHLSAWQKVL